ncbi:protein kinase [Plasmodium gonderi]|uniref:Protein kinase n=1 Tax=Plasmodium gonderi TaxID=77519 RepID=A0A1Y1J9S6_PLAGO|nr:protein kinase [Plasmodium gonderi]GAW79020.1 protein kinase [Plasmodium gonderi]
MNLNNQGGVRISSKMDADGLISGCLKEKMEKANEDVKSIINYVRSNNKNEKNVNFEDQTFSKEKEGDNKWNSYRSVSTNIYLNNFSVDNDMLNQSSNEEYVSMKTVLDTEGKKPDVNYNQCNTIKEYSMMFSLEHELFPPSCELVDSKCKTDFDHRDKLQGGESEKYEARKEKEGKNFISTKEDLKKASYPVDHVATNSNIEHANGYVIQGRKIKTLDKSTTDQNNNTRNCNISNNSHDQKLRREFTHIIPDEEPPAEKEKKISNSVMKKNATKNLNNVSIVNHDLRKSFSVNQMSLRNYTLHYENSLQMEFSKGTHSLSLRENPTFKNKSLTIDYDQKSSNKNSEVLKDSLDKGLHDHAPGVNKFESDNGDATNSDEVKFKEPKLEMEKSVKESISRDEMAKERVSTSEESEEKEAVSIFFKGDRRFFNFDLPANELIEKSSFEIIELISEGSFGTVYKAKWNGKMVAVKKSQIQMSLEGMRSIVREINTYRSVSHENIVKYHGVCIDQSFIGLILEYIPKGNVFDLLYNSTSVVPYETRIHMAFQLVSVLHYLHSVKGIVHRDLKTSNFLFDEEYNIKICDFGKTRKLSKDGKIILEDNGGSPRYMAPECFIEGNSIDEKSDIWGLACCLIEIFASQIPFQHIKQKEDVVIEILVNKQKPNIPNCFHPKLYELLEKSFSTNPEERPSCSEYLKLLQEFYSKNGKS